MILRGEFLSCVPFHIFVFKTTSCPHLGLSAPKSSSGQRKHPQWLSIDLVLSDKQRWQTFTHVNKQPRCEFSAAITFQGQADISIMWPCHRWQWEVIMWSSWCVDAHVTCYKCNGIVKCMTCMLIQALKYWYWCKTNFRDNWYREGMAKRSEIAVNHRWEGFELRFCLHLFSFSPWQFEKWFTHGNKTYKAWWEIESCQSRISLKLNKNCFFCIHLSRKHQVLLYTVRGNCVLFML